MKGLDLMNEKLIENSINALREELQTKFNVLTSCYAMAKDYLIIRAINIENVKTESVYKKIGTDLCLTLYLLLSDKDGLINTVQIPECMLDDWSVTRETAFENAMNNTADRYKAIYSENIFDIENSCKPVKEFKISNRNHTILVTTTRKTNGSIAMFFKDTCESIAAGIDSSFYAAFTSIHECMIHAVGSISPECIKRNLQETNRIFGPDDTLTNNVFYYDKDAKTFEPINV